MISLLTPEPVVSEHPKTSSEILTYADVVGVDHIHIHRGALDTGRMEIFFKDGAVGRIDVMSFFNALQILKNYRAFRDVSRTY